MVTEWMSGRIEKVPYKANGDGKMPKKIQDTYEKIKRIPTVRKVYVTNEVVT